MQQPGSSGKQAVQNKDDVQMEDEDAAGLGGNQDDAVASEVQNQDHSEDKDVPNSDEQAPASLTAPNTAHRSMQLKNILEAKAAASEEGSVRYSSGGGVDGT